ncbi:phosphopantetheine-binding protein [Amycolatopsis japonica]|uniref:phosphopantetheine-binding protein n=1 Tax=Amycolatopsis japonica TaxID=208439 RepID=UPI0037980CA1
MKPRHPDAAERSTALTAIWREVLRNEDLSENSDLFEYGGMSLHVLQIVGRIYDTLGIDVKPRHVFRHSSPLGLSDFLEKESEKGPRTRQSTRP